MPSFLFRFFHCLAYRAIIKKEIAEEFSKKAKEIMENVLTLKVPLVVDVEIGDNWGEL